MENGKQKPADREPGSGQGRQPVVSSGAPADRASILLVMCALCVFGCLFCLQSPASAEEIKSWAAVVMDSMTGRVLYAKNPEQRLMPASTTKLMTALVVIEKANLTDVVTVSRKAVNTAPTRSGLKEGDKVTIETLLYAALMKSANDAATALAEAVAGSEGEFVKMMNLKAVAIGANDTRFINANGLPGKGQHITAYDLAKIMRHAIRYPVLKEILGTRVTEVSTETGKPIFIRNTNRLLWSDEELLGGKTGYTRQARHCFACAGERDNETIVVALLGAPSRDVLWKESESLMEFGSRVLNKTEEPVVYLSKMDHDFASATRAAYSEGGDGPEKAKYVKKTKKGRHAGARKGSTRMAKKQGSKKPVELASNKTGQKHAAIKKTKNKSKGEKSPRQLAKKKRVKRSQIAKKGENGIKG